MKKRKEDDKSNIVFVGGLRKSTTEDKVAGHFSKFGQVDSVDIKRLPDGTSRGFAFVKFVEVESIAKVLEAQSSHMIDNKWVAVKPHGGTAFTEDKNRERAK
ncbi:sqd, partial [Symbiodinium necroappetens]